jgi:ubiquinone/menaquinone biosynthesis C-methylase UbiE
MVTIIMEEPSLDDEIQKHYESVDEAGRLDHTENEIEKVRTQELLAWYLPPPPADILDLGGGAGVYAFWLAERGYQVNLIDGTPRHIEQARAAAQQAGAYPLASIEVGDARQLALEDNSFDGVLLFGPLYHLTKRGDRITALRETLRVLRPGGVLMAASINRFASTIAGMLEGLVNDETFTPIYEQDLRDGQHRNPTDNTAFFTTAYFHYPQELIDELLESGFRFEALLAVEGPARLTKNFAEQWGIPEMRERILKIVRHVEAEPTLWGVSAHIMAIGKKV